MLIETQDNEPIIHPLVSDPIKEVSALFGKETLDSREVKMFAETSREYPKFDTDSDRIEYITSSGI